MQSTKRLKKVTIFFVICLMTFLGILVSSIILTNSNGMGQRLQGWANLLWLPFILLILIVDRICVRKFGSEKVNKIQRYILGGMVFIFIINLIRLRLQA